MRAATSCCGLRSRRGTPFVASRVEAAQDGLGPAGTGSHTVEETVNLPSIGRAARGPRC
jgi:hypothetical protein